MLQINVLANYYLKLEPKLMSLYRWCDHWIGVHLPGWSKSLIWSCTGEVMGLSLINDNWWIRLITWQNKAWKDSLNSCVLWDFGICNLHMNFQRVQTVNIIDFQMLSPFSLKEEECLYSLKWQERPFCIVFIIFQLIQVFGIY